MINRNGDQDFNRADNNSRLREQRKYILCGRREISAALGVQSGMSRELQLTFIDLFCGIGGFHLGLSRNGFRCMWANDNNKYPCKVYRKRFPDTPLHEGDIREVNTDDIPDHDLLCAGFPCQSFSIAGKRRGLDDTRGTLFFEICRIAKDKRPSLLLLENVKGLLSHEKGRTFAIILLLLDELGYDAEWQVLNSKHFGVPQNRERVFIVGHLRGKSRCEVFPLAEDKVNHKMDEEILNAPTLTASYSADSYGAGRPYVIDGDVRWREVKSCGESRGRILGLSLPSGESCGEQGRGDTDCTGGNTTLMLPTQDKKWPFSLIHVSGMDARRISNAPKPMRNSGMTRLRGTREETDLLMQHFKTKDGELLEFGNMRLRALTPMEFERLQGFPDGWTGGLSDTQRYKALGNAVTVNVVGAIGKRIREFAYAD